MTRPIEDDDWYEHIEVDGHWEHLYDAYLNHQASGAKAPRRGESMDMMPCRCTPERRAAHIARAKARAQ